MRIGSLCSGYGGLELAAEILIPDAELAWLSEIDPHANTVLAARFPEIPNIGNFATTEAPPVEVLTAGFPCQPISAAGRSKGIHDERWIWPGILAFVGRLDPPPRLLLFENVPRLLTVNDGNAMAQVVEGLASLGYVGRYRLLRASDIGAGHLRERWFCVASYADGAGGWQDAGAAHGDETADGPQHDLVSVGTGQSWLPTPAARDGKGRDTPGRRGGVSLPELVRLLPTPTASRSRQATHAGAKSESWTLMDIAHDDAWGRYLWAIRRHEATTGLPAPNPAINGKLNPVFVEWMMMLPPGWVTDLAIPRTAQIRILGNGAIPYQAATAYASLL